MNGKKIDDLVELRVKNMQKLGDAYSNAFLAESIAKHSDLTERDKEALARATVRACQSLCDFMLSNPYLRDAVLGR
jgi:hypothetical protein